MTLVLESTWNVDTRDYPTKIRKRDGREVDFDATRISAALRKCFVGIGKPDKDVEPITARVCNAVAAMSVVTVEGVQDAVVHELMASREYTAAEHYILYRERHRQEREQRPVPDDVRAAFDDSDRYFPTPIQKFQFFDKYSRFNYELGRRETYRETVDRSVTFLRHLVITNTGVDLGEQFYFEIRDGMLEMAAMPSMRLLAMAGPAAERDNATIYNCTYLPVCDIRAFAEALLLSMAGCGVGFSVEEQYVEQFPRIARQKGIKLDTYVVPDSTEGWAKALVYGFDAWFKGYDVDFDYSKIRPAGSPLRTKGGRASGPKPLQEMLDFARERILARQGRLLRTIDAHDLMCKVGDAAVSGGMRRTAMISLYSFGDLLMRQCKSGDFETTNPQRWNANNSEVWPDEDIEPMSVIEQTIEMVRSKRGEPGIFNLRAVRNTLPSRRRFRDTLRTNPCGEIVLDNYQMCNLSIAVARAGDTYASLARKVRLAARIGTIQSLATHFPYLREEWAANCREERLLGVDITGQMDCATVRDPNVMLALRLEAVDENYHLATRLGINPSAAITTAKPSGNSSQLLDCASGIHARWAPYYERNVRVSAYGTLYKVLRDAGVPMDPENGQTADTASTWVVHFPIKSPDGAITRQDRGAIEQCNYWKTVKLNWTEHNPSVTITYRDDEVPDLLKWIWENRDIIGGMAFLPVVDAKYAQLPYIEISADEYERRAAVFPDIDFSKIWRYESTDLTTAAQEVACLAGICDI